jgi:hypothetical protein
VVPASVSLAPATATIGVQGTAQFTATVRGSDGSTMTGVSLAWTSSAPSVATVNGSGLATAVTCGAATISAATTTTPSLSASAQLQIPAGSQPRLALGALTTLNVGATAQANATARRCDGSAIASPAITWSTSAPAVATISTSGLITGVAAGTAIITATSADTAVSTSLVVESPPIATLTLPTDRLTLIPGLVRQVIPTATDASGRVLSGRPVQYVSSNASAVSVSPAGVLTANAPGTATITMTAEGKTVLLPVAVVAPLGVSTNTTQIVEPRDFNMSAPDSVMVTLLLPVPSTSVVFVPRAGATRPFRALSSTRYTITLSPNDIMSAYEANQTSWIGSYDITNANGTSRLNAVVPVRTASMPTPAITARSAVAQQSARVLNLQLDTLMDGMGLRAFALTGSPLARRVYALVPDQFDFLITVENAETASNRYYALLRNSETGTGQPILAGEAGWGSASRLRGHVTVPTLSFFDGAENNMNHEIGHNWLSRVPGISTIPHWTKGDLAYGVMGFSDASGQGSTWRYRVDDTNPADLRWRCPGLATTFTDVDLYLMGLLPRDSVKRTFYQPVSDPGDPLCNSSITTPLRRLTVDSVVAALGSVRAPATQRDFRVGTVIFSLGRLLSPNEMAWAEAMAVRAEGTTELTGNMGIAIGLTARPWFLATGGRSRLDLRMP